MPATSGAQSLSSVRAGVEGGWDAKDEGFGTSVQDPAPSQCCSSDTAARRASLATAHLLGTSRGQSVMGDDSIILEKGSADIASSSEKSQTLSMSMLNAWADYGGPIQYSA